MAQLSIVAFDPVGLALVRKSQMNAGMVQQSQVGGAAVTVIQHRLRGRIQDGLPVRFITGSAYGPADNATAGSFD